MFEQLFSFLPQYVYCESSVSAIAQPLNFLSSAIYWFVGIWLWHNRSVDEDGLSFHQLAAVLFFLLGMSGMAWHVGQHPVALAVDMGLMFMMLIAVAAALCNDVLRMETVNGFVVLIVLIFVSTFLKDSAIWFLPQNAGIFLPMMFFMAIVSLRLQNVSEEATVYILTAAYLFLLGLLFRGADSYLCGYFPQGLHFLWHIMFAFSVLYVSKTLDAMKHVPEQIKPAAEPLDNAQD